MTTPSIQPAIQELERLFIAFAPLFNREMPLPVITIQSKGRKQAAGWFVAEKWSDGGRNGRLPEINICAEHLARSPEDIAEVMLHEMCHYANCLDGIQDCTVRQYHNLHFKEKCDEIGLICEKSSRRGWSKTSLSDELREAVDALNIDADAFSIFRVDQSAKKPETKMKKWRCGCTTIRAAVLVEATCNRCNLEFKLQNG